MTFSFFMHDQPILEHAAEQIVPFASSRDQIKIWDAGCAHGQETYSIAMIFAEKMTPSGFNNLRIDATDCVNHIGEVVQDGVYRAEELRLTPRDLVTKYFETDDTGVHCRVVDTLRSRVSFQYHDLLTFQPIGRDYGLIVCKHVLSRFHYLERVEIFRMFHQALAPGPWRLSGH